MFLQASNLLLSSALVSISANCSLVGLVVLLVDQRFAGGFAQAGRFGQWDVRVGTMSHVVVGKDGTSVIGLVEKYSPISL